jgi:putative NADH-flavin reductase
VPILPYLLVYALLLNLGLALRGLRGGTAGAVRAAAAPAAILRVLVVGATGGTGRELVQQALARGLAVTAFVRNPERLAIEHPALTVVQGDVLDAASLARAAQGQDAVLCALGHKRFYAAPFLLSQGTRHLLAAMASSGARRLVCTTTLGLGDSAGRLGLLYTFFVTPFVLPLYFWDKTRQERLLAASGLDWVIVRPGALTNGPRRGTLRHGQGVGSLLLTVSVSRADVAAFMLDQLADDHYLHRAVGVTA